MSAGGGGAGLDSLATLWLIFTGFLTDRDKVGGGDTGVKAKLLVDTTILFVVVAILAGVVFGGRSNAFAVLCGFGAVVGGVGGGGLGEGGGEEGAKGRKNSEQQREDEEREGFDNAGHEGWFACFGVLGF